MAQIKTVQADLRAKYKRYFEISLIFTLLMLIAAFKLAPDASNSAPIKNDGADIIKVEDIPNTQHESTKPTEPKPAVPILSFVEDIEDIPFEDTEINFENIPELPRNPESDRKIVEVEETIFRVVEEYPQIVGGIKSLIDKIKYTEIARRAGIEGKVIVAATIDRNGDVVDVEILKSLAADLDEVALNAVKQLKFIPGKQREKPVKVQIMIPIEFKLN